MKLHTIKTIGALAIAFSLALTVSVAQAEEDTAATSPSPKPDIRVQAEMRRDQKPVPLEKRVEARKEIQAEVRDIRQDAKVQVREIKKDTRQALASTSVMFKRDAKELRAEIKKKMETREFEARKNALVRELMRALENLNDIVTRIESRITKAESEGRTMTEPKALLVTAKQKIEKAKLDVAALQGLTASSTPVTTGTTTTQVDLVKPRQIGEVAIKSVKDARDALQKVVVSIAHNMGLKTGQKVPPSGSTTPPTSGTTTSTN